MNSFPSPGAPRALWILQLAILFAVAHPAALAQAPSRPVLLSDLQDVTVDAGQGVALRVTLQSTTNRLYFQWSKDGDFLPQSVNGPELIITNAFSRHAGQYQVQILIPDVFPTPITNSRVATVTVLSPTGLRITRQPEDTRARVNDPLTFSVEAQSSWPLRYQWFFNGSPISLETQPSLTVGTHVGFFGGGYSVIVSDGLDEVESRRALGTVQSFPIITQQPQSTRVRRGSTVTFSVTATGKGPITYRWQSTVPLPPGTVTNGPTLTLSEVTQAHAGGYWVILKDAEGQGSSNSAELAILPEISFTIPSYQAALAAGTNASFGSLPGTGPALSVALLKPNGGAVGPDGSVVFANTGSHVIKKLTPDQQVLDVAGSGIAGYLDGPALSSRFQDPLGACVDARGWVYVADSGNHRIRRVAPDGTVSTLAGSGVAGGAEGTGTAPSSTIPSTWPWHPTAESWSPSSSGIASATSPPTASSRLSSAPALPAAETVPGTPHCSTARAAWPPTWPETSTSPNGAPTPSGDSAPTGSSPPSPAPARPATSTDRPPPRGSTIPMASSSRPPARCSSPTAITTPCAACPLRV